jgi:hypothetical protein
MLNDRYDYATAKVSYWSKAGYQVVDCKRQTGQCETLRVRELACRKDLSEAHRPPTTSLWQVA